MVQLNARELTSVQKRIGIDRWANKFKIDVMFFQESKINSNCVMETENYIWFFSSKVKNEDRERSDKLKATNQNIPQDLRNATAEHRGVGIAFYKGYMGTIEQVSPKGDRLMTAKLRSRNTLNLIAAYAPTSAAETTDKEFFMMN